MATETAHDGLRPAIGARLLYLMVVGDILGAGIYILVGDVAGELGGMAWLAFATAFGIAALSAYYHAWVTLGPGAFVETALGFEDFQRAMTRKLLRELQSPALAGLSPREPGSRAKSVAERAARASSSSEVFAAVCR